MSSECSLHNWFQCNLLSISKITLDLNCNAVFSLFVCQFQDQILGRVIGSAKESPGLYYFLQSTSPSNKQHTALSCSTSLTKSQIFFLLHCRLGHPNFMYLKRLFPLLLKNNGHFECDVCQIAKHKRIPFPLRPYQPSQPFFLIHSDLWGPSRVTTHIDKKWFITFTNDHSRV